MARKVAAAAQKAALEALRAEAQQRAELVGAAAETQDQHAQLLEQLAAAASAHQQTYQAALDGGWTAEQLADLGIHSIDATARRKPSKTTTSPRAPRAARPAAAPLDTDATAPIDSELTTTSAY